jgi:hypothetical protein
MIGNIASGDNAHKDSKDLVVLSPHLGLANRTWPP